VRHKPRGLISIAARGGWLALAAITLGMLIGGAPSLYHQVAAGCPASPCYEWQLDALTRQRFEQAGVSLSAYAVYFVAVDALFSLAYYSLAVLIFIWAADELVSMLTAYTLLLFGGVSLSANVWAFGFSNAMWEPVVIALSTISTVVALTFLYVFPDGRFVPRWLRWVALVLMPLLLVQALPTGTFIDVGTWPQPWPFVYTSALYGSAVLAQIYRLRANTTPLQRQQTKSVVLGFAVGLSGFFVLRMLFLLREPIQQLVPFLDANSPWYQIIFQGAVNVFLVVPAIAIAAAITRYRLFDIDVIINRAFVYGSVTAILCGAFLLASSVAQRAIEATTGGRADLVTFGIAVLVALGFRPLHRRMRVLADRILPARQELALLFTDIVSSTDRLAELGDARWRAILDQYRSTVRRELRHHGGSEMHIAGDSFFVTFTDPRRAVRCALALVPALRAIDVPSRFGLHWGTCEMRGEEVSGIAVWAAARVMSTAGADEIVLSDTMRRLVEDDHLPLEDRGVHHLKGIPGDWRLHAIGRR
jgi:class 3 adenylate cyclase